MRALSLALAGLLVLLGAPASAEIFRWTDERGTVHFTDSLHGVPPAYRERARALRDDLPPPPPIPRVPLEHTPAGYVVAARVNGGSTVRLLVDTGATSTVLSPAAAELLGLRVRNEPPVQVQTAGGTVQAGWATVAEIEVGGRRAGPMKVVVHDALQGADGLLGMNFLGAFRVEILADDLALILTPR